MRYISCDEVLKIRQIFTHQAMVLEKQDKSAKRDTIKGSTVAT